jgi:NAD kinase
MNKRHSSSFVSSECVLIVYKYFHEDAIKYAKLIAQFLIQENLTYSLYVEDMNPFKEIVSNSKNTKLISVFNKDIHCKMINLVIVIGGDGTTLWASNLFNNCTKPYFITYNLGTLGYLTYYNCKEYEKVLRELLIEEDRVISFETRSTLDVEFISEDPNLKEVKLNCLNDVVFEKGGNTHMIKTHIFVNDEVLTSVRSDGVLISTSTGSTAYNLSSGGSIIHYDSDVLTLNAICPFSLSFRPIIFPRGIEIKFILDNSCLFAMVGNDGINNYRIKPEEGIKIKLSEFDLKIIILDRIISNPLVNWRNKLINQLGWNSEFKNN